MRVYELAAKIGTTSQTVMRLAGENDVEVYSPLSSLEAEEVETLNAAFLKVGVEQLKAEAEAARDRRLAKARRALKAAEEANRLLADDLEAKRQRATRHAHQQLLALLDVPWALCFQSLALIG